MKEWKEQTIHMLLEDMIKKSKCNLEDRIAIISNPESKIKYDYICAAYKPNCIYEKSIYCIFDKELNKRIDQISKEQDMFDYMNNDSYP